MMYLKKSCNKIQKQSTQYGHKESEYIFKKKLSGSI